MKDHPIASRYTKEARLMEGESEAEDPAPHHTVTGAADALAQLYRLLEDYSPSWYEKRHRQKAEGVLRKLGRL
jgi:hypothetical protein